MPESKVKEEPEEPELPSDPVEVPPGVVLDKLEALVTSGKTLLRFQRSGDKGWGINGRVGQWSSFKVDAAGVCEFVDDDTVWATEAASEWAESELEWLEKLRKQALSVPATPAQQPNALRPRQCRRAVFAYHKAEYVKQRQAKAKAKAKAEEGSTLAPPATGAAAAPPAKAVVSKTAPPPAKPAVVKAAPPPAKPAVSKAPAAPAKQPQPQPDAAPAKAKLTPTVKSPSPPAGPPPAKTAGAAVTPKANGAKVMSFQSFLATVKSRLTESGQRDKYKQFLAVVSKGAQEAAIAAALAGYDDLIEEFRQLPKGGAAKQPQAAPPKAVQDAAAAPEPAAPVEETQPDTPSALPRTLLSPVDVEKEVLAPLRQCGGKAAVQLVKCTLEKRDARASLRLAMLKYARTQSMEEGAFREMIILRGPPGMGKSTWAMEQLRLQVGLVEDEELVARLTHICSADDFCMKFKSGDEEEFVADPEQLEMAYARNEARALLAMEVGIHPLYIDNQHLQLWEMAPYVRKAQAAGYEVSVVSPQDIFMDWNELEPLAARNAERPEARAAPREQLEAALQGFEPLPEGEDPVSLILEAKRPAAPATPAKPAAGAKAPAAKAPAAGSGAKAPALPAVAKRPAPPPSAPPPAKVAKVPQPPARPPSGTPAAAKSGVVKAAPAAPVAAAGQSTEARVAASLLSGLRKKA
mmetsp:Transcript_49171/g.152640  ORF Transcript_49171/g.152640 Transcript_49171/m.152640 type:complete len:692 (+) Transcript_49171:40-2115(+)